MTQLSACLLALAVLSLLLPTAFHASFSDNTLADRAVVTLSRGSSVILLIIYVLYLLFQLKSHSYLYQGTPQHIIDKESAPGFLARFDSTSSSLSGSTLSTNASSGSNRRVNKRLRAKLGRKKHKQVEIETTTNVEDSPQPAEASVESERARKLKALIHERLDSRNKCRLLRQAGPKQKACLEGCLLELHPSFVPQLILRRPKALDRIQCHTTFDVSNHSQAIRQMQVESATLLPT